LQETPAALSSCANSDRSGAAAAADAADARTVLGADVTPSLGDRGRLAIANKGKVGCVGKQRCINAIKWGRVRAKPSCALAELEQELPTCSPNLRSVQMIDNRAAGRGVHT